MAELSFDTGTLRVNTMLLGPRLNHGIAGVMMSNAPKVQSYARANAKWQDQTGNARQGLMANYSRPGGESHQITLAHSVPYGIWLEVRWAGKYAIIGPTIRVESVRIMGALRGLLTKIGGVL